MSNKDMRDSVIIELESLIKKLEQSEVLDYNMECRYNKGYFNGTPFREDTGVVIEVIFKENV